MNEISVTQAMRDRKSVRAFRECPVPQALVREILELAGQSPSGGNLQPWKVYAFAGEALVTFVQGVKERCLTNPAGEGAESAIYPPGLPEPYRTRRFACGEAMYEALGIAREDKGARLGQVFKNFEFFGAPVGLIITMDPIMVEAQCLDIGIFLQSVMLLAKERGLDTCPQASWRMWPKSISELLGVGDREIVMAGIALGYAASDQAINEVSQPRVPAEEFISLRGF